MSEPKPKHPTVASEWALYANNVIPPTAPTTQLVESRRAFYAGAQALIAVLSSADEREHEEITIGRVTEELRRFFQEFVGTTEEARSARRRGGN